MLRRRGFIYRDKAHLAITLSFVVAPFLFLIVTAHYSRVPAQVLFADLATSTLRLFIAYIIAAALGWICAVGFFRGRRALIALPMFDVLQSFPTFAALPLAVYLWGASSTLVIVLLVLEIIWPIFFTVISPLKQMKRDLEDAVKISGLTGWSYIRHFLWPLSVPALITGSIIGLGDAWQSLVATEIIVNTPAGLGSFFQMFQTSKLMTSLGIFGLLLFIFSINKLVWLPLLEWSHKKMEE